MLEPGAIFEVPPDLADPPQRPQQLAPPRRDSRWVVVVSSKADCRDRNEPTVIVVLLSAKTEYQDRHDVLILRPDGGIQRDSIAQTDLIFTVLKDDLGDDRYRGTVLRDTMVRIRARLVDTLGYGGGGVG